MAEVKIDGTSYELPESFTLGEMMIVERYCGGNLEGFGLAQLCGAIHVAIARAKPEASYEEINEAIGALPMETLEDFTAGQSPPADGTSDGTPTSNVASLPPLEADRGSAIRANSGSRPSEDFPSDLKTSVS